MNSWSSLATPARISELIVETFTPALSIEFPSEVTGRFGWETALTGYAFRVLVENRPAAIRLEFGSTLVEFGSRSVLVQYADKT
jgi:hypothetical protein